MNVRTVSTGVSVFAYGSNLCSSRIEARIGSVETIAVARLDGYALRFHKRSVDGSAKADAFHTTAPDDHVWGAIYELSRSAKRELDRIEGVGAHYVEQEVRVVSADGRQVDTCVYVAHPSRIDHGLQPYAWYHRFVVEGARRHGFPSDYIAMLEAVDVVEDPDRARHRRETAILVS